MRRWRWIGVAAALALGGCLDGGSAGQVDVPCTPACEHGGRCVAGACACTDGFDGPSCAVDRRLGLDFSCVARVSCCGDGDGDGRCAADGSEDLLWALGARGEYVPVVAVGFACTFWGDAAQSPELYLDALALDCEGDASPELTLDPLASVERPCPAGEDLSTGCPAVQEAPGVDADDYLDGIAYFRGHDVIASGGAVYGRGDAPSRFGDSVKLYANLLFGVVRPGLMGCVLRGRATGVSSTSDHGPTPGVLGPDVVYPYVTWSVPLGSCAAEQLVFDSAEAPIHLAWTHRGEPALGFVGRYAPDLTPEPR